MSRTARFHRPPSWLQAWGISLLHGIAVGGVYWAILLAAPGGGFLFILMTVASLVALFAILVALFPYGRVVAIASWLSPITAWSLCGLLVLPRGPPPPAIWCIESALLMGAIGAAVNLVTFVATVPFLKMFGRCPIEDPSRCRECGYSLASLQVARCPECGHPIPPTPNA